MPRTARAAVGGYVCHFLNRGNACATIFHKPADSDAFPALLAEGKSRASVEVFAYCLVPDHSHLGLRPAGGGDMPAFMRWVCRPMRLHGPVAAGVGLFKAPTDF